MREVQYLDGLRTPYSVPMQIGRFEVVVNVNHRQLETIVKRYFAPFLVDELRGGDALEIVGIQGDPLFDTARMPSVGRVAKVPKICFYDRDEVRVIRKNRTGVLHYIYGDRFVAVGDLVRYPQQLLNLVSTAYGHRLRKEGHVAIHASCVCGEEGALVFAGQSGSGKSSVSLALMEFGFDYVTNDRTFLRRQDGRGVLVAGVPKWPRVNPGTLLANERLRKLLSRAKDEQYSRMDPRELWWVEDKHDVPVESVYGKGRLALHSRLRTLYVLNWRQNRRPLRLREISQDRASELLSPFYKTDVYDAPPVEPGVQANLGEIVRGSQIIEVTGGVDIPRLLNLVVGAPSTARATA